MALRARYSWRRKAGGAALVEMALLMPVLLLLAIPVFNVMRNLMAQTVVTNVAREVANLASRPGGHTDGKNMEYIMSAVGATTPPINLAAHGNIVVTEYERDAGCSANRCPAKVVRSWNWKNGAAGGGGSAKALPFGWQGKHVFVVDVYYRAPVSGLPSLNIPYFGREQIHAWAIF